MQKANKESHVPMRTCIACRARAPKKEMVRFVIAEDGVPMIDMKGKISGRGANLCQKKECFDLAVKKGAFGRAFKKKIDNDVWPTLEKEFEKVLESIEFRGKEESVTYRVKKEEAESAVGHSVTKRKVEK